MENRTLIPYAQYKEEEILPLYEAVGWSNYTRRPDMLRRAFENSLFIAAAYQENRLVGLVRVVGDGASIVYIQDLLVLPTYQRQGVGSALLQMVLEKYKQVYQKILLTDSTEKTLAFYQKLGLTKVQDMGCTGFMYINA